MKHCEWKIPYQRPQIPPAIADLGYAPLLCAVLAVRGISTADEARRLIEDDESCLHDARLILGMDSAVARIKAAIAGGEHVAVYGDYDVDGITATCLLTDYLRSKGLDCRPYIPDRVDEGYGLNCAALDELAAGGVSLVITVDCGITAMDEARHARQIGLDMIITDHHECKGALLPDALAVIDCKQSGDNYPNKNLAGVGVALKLVCACEGDSAAMLERYADLVAVGTIADVVPLTGENRFLVRRGLKKLETNPLTGIAAIMKEAAVSRQKLTAAAVGFGIAPRLNAAGRLGRTACAARLLMCRSMSEAEGLASELCRLNKQRQDIGLSIWEEACAQLEGSELDAPIVLASDSWHQGVIGIAASRLSEQYLLPTIIICTDGEHGKGSCRSYGDFNLFEALSACAEHLLGFGGHALAAGLTIDCDKIEDFKSAIGEYYRAHRPSPQPEVVCELLIDDARLLSIDNVRALDLMEPFGNSNPKPVMCMSGVSIEGSSCVGGGRHMRLTVRLGKAMFDGIFFSHTQDELGIRRGDLVDIAFTPQINEFRGQVSVQLLLRALRPHESFELCRELLEKNEAVYPAAARYLPDRGDFVRIWRELLQVSPLEGEPSDIIKQCPQGMEPERFCICLAAFNEAGLIAGEGGGVYKARCVQTEAKADLTATDIMTKLSRLKI